MADTTTISTGDHRRAGTLTVHYGRGDAEGVNTVLAETLEADRVMQLITAVMYLHAYAASILYTPDGLACLTQMVHTLAGDSDADPDCWRAARLIIAYSGDDVVAFNKVSTEAAAVHRGTELLMGLFAVYSAFVPILYGTLGLDVLQRTILDLVAREEGAE